MVLAVLLSSAVSDWRKREASDLHWAVIMGIGCVLFAIRLYDAEASPVSYAAVASMAFMAADLLWERETGVKVDLALYLLIIASTVMAVFSLRDGDLLWNYMSIPVMYLLMNALYYSGVVRGGADAKAVIAVAFVCPLYPVFGDLSLIGIPSGSLPLFVVPAFSVFMIAALLTVLLAVPYAIANIARGDAEFPNMFAGIRMGIDRAEKSHVWPMEDVVDGVLRSNMSGTEDPEVFQRLRAFGAEKIWVTLIIPFLVPITIAYAIVVFLGNPLFLIA